MYLTFEFLFYLGLIALGIGIVWLLATVVRRRWKRIKYPALVVILGIASIAAPAIYTRYQVIDLGPRVAMVQGEKHVTLTGWDRDDYAVLLLHPETTVLQMANPDVGDETLEYLRGMANLRELDLNDTGVTDAGMAELAKLTGLKALKLRGTRVTDTGLREHLSRLPSLNRLNVQLTSISSEAIEAWKSGGEDRRAMR